MKIMKRDRLFKIVTILVVLYMTLLPITTNASSLTSTSTNYGVNQVYFGAGGVVGATSSNYGANETLGDTGVGNTGSANYQIYAGFNTTADPFLAFVVNSATIDLGVLHTGSTASTSATFSVRAWEAGGYIIQNASPAPSNGSHTINALSSPTASSAGTEQFGINLVANTSPSVGANPQQCPNVNQCPYSGSPTFSYGVAATNYNTANLFKYVNGDTIADSTQSSSVMQYTISYIFNIAVATPPGQYNFTHVLVATATY
jgi:hypothetical protein